jgi:hypothetical protein
MKNQYTEEDRDWQLFLLLEGELEGEEKEKVLQLIETDAGWRTDWQLMQKSVLPKDVHITLTEQEKSKLKKHTAKVLPLRLNASWIAYAAAASVILLTFWFWRTSDTASEKSIVRLPENNLPTPSPEPSQDVAAELPSNSENKLGNEQNADTAIISDGMNKREPQVPSEPEKTSIEHDHIQLALAQRLNIELPQDRSPVEMPVPLLTKMTFVNQASSKIDGLAFNAFEWANNARRLWSAIQDPELSFSRVKNTSGQGVAINFRSEGYETTAQLIVKNDFIQNFKSK